MAGCENSFSLHLSPASDVFCCFLEDIHSDWGGWGGGKEPQCFLRALDRAGLAGVGGVMVLLQLSLVPPSVSLLIPGYLHPQSSREGTLSSALLS